MTWEIDNTWGDAYKLMTQNAKVYVAGSAALDLAYVAMGRLDGFFEKVSHLGTSLPGSLMVTEAGGIVGTFAGESDYLYKGDVLAGTPKVFGQMVNALQTP